MRQPGSNSKRNDKAIEEKTPRQALTSPFSLGNCSGGDDCSRIRGLAKRGEEAQKEAQIGGSDDVKYNDIRHRGVFLCVRCVVIRIVTCVCECVEPQKPQKRGRRSIRPHLDITHSQARHTQHKEWREWEDRLCSCCKGTCRHVTGSVRGTRMWLLPGMVGQLWRPATQQSCPVVRSVRRAVLECRPCQQHRVLLTVLYK